jgi:hypothetical protein
MANAISELSQICMDSVFLHGSSFFVAGCTVGVDLMTPTSCSLFYSSTMDPTMRIDCKTDVRGCRSRPTVWVEGGPWRSQFTTPDPASIRMCGTTSSGTPGR